MRMNHPMIVIFGRVLLAAAARQSKNLIVEIPEGEFANRRLPGGLVAVVLDGDPYDPADMVKIESMGCHSGFSSRGPIALFLFFCPNHLDDDRLWELNGSDQRVVIF